MAMEDNIRLIVEQVLSELGKNPQVAANVSGAASPTGNGATNADNITDLAKVDLQRYLQVPEPLNRGLYEEMKLSTPARLGVWRCGTRPLTDTWLRFRADHAVAQDSVLGEVPEEFPAKYNMVCLKTQCESKDEYLTRPDLGRKLDEASLNLIRTKCRKGLNSRSSLRTDSPARRWKPTSPTCCRQCCRGWKGWASMSVLPFSFNMRAWPLWMR